jgi:D-alanyl-lipoteichoic acid acyltransferase DltB (MBOAT superfamily)
MIAGVVYIVGTLVALCCAILLLRGYARGRQRLLLWSGLCFFGLAISNFLVFVDMTVFPTQFDLYPLRLGTAAVAMLLLLYGLIWEGE